jgi:hypothetical protein
MNMQEDLGELMRLGRMEGAERRRLGLLNNSGHQGKSMKVESLRYRFEDSLGKGDNHGDCGHGGRRGHF